MKGISLTKGSTLNIEEADLIKEAVQWLITENKRLVIENKKLTKNDQRWSNELDLQLKYSEYLDKQNAKLTKGLNDIKSQLFDVNRCDTILTKSIEQLLKN